MRRAGVALGLVLLSTAPVGAQTPRAEVSGGYAFMHDADRVEDFAAGWVVSATGNVNSWIAVAAEVGGSYRTCENCQRGPFVSQRLQGRDLDTRVYTYIAGPKVAARGLPAATPFAQFLVGGSHVGGGIEWDGALNTGFTYQPGGGVDIGLTPRTGIRLQADYRIIRAQGRHNKQTRVLGGLVWRMGEL